MKGYSVHYFEPSKDDESVCVECGCAQSATHHR